MYYLTERVSDETTSGREVLTDMIDPRLKIEHVELMTVLDIWSSDHAHNHRLSRGSRNRQ